MNGMDVLWKPSSDRTHHIIKKPVPMWLTSDAKKLLDKPWWSPFCPLEPPEWFSLSSGIWQHSLHLRVMVTALFSRWAQSLLITDLHMAWSLVLSSAWPPSCEGPFILIINNHHLSNTWYYVPHNAKTLAFQFHIIIIYHKILSCFWFVFVTFVIMYACSVASDSLQLHGL